MIWSTRRLTVIGLVVCLLLGVTIFVWGSIAQLAGAVIAPGQIRVESYSQSIEHPDGGRVKSIAVADGDFVAEGDLLMSLDRSELDVNRKALEDSLVLLATRAARLEAERDGAETLSFSADLMAAAARDPAVDNILQSQSSLFATRLSTFTETLNSLADQRGQTQRDIEGQTAVIASLDEQLRLLADSLARAEELASKNLIQTSQLLALQREAASLTGQRANTIAGVASANGRIAQIDSEKARLVAVRKQEAATELAQVREDYVRQSDEMDILTLKIDRLEIRAPVAGIIHGMTVRGAGSVVRPATPVLHIVPQGVLVVEVHIEPTQIDSVFAGQTVLLRFPAFDTRTTPELDGKIARVAADVTVDERNGVAAYIAEIDVAPDELARLGQKKLIPGMPVEAYIQTGERSPLSYIAKPFTDYFARAFRD